MLCACACVSVFCHFMLCFKCCVSWLQFSECCGNFFQHFYLSTLANLLSLNTSFSFFFLFLSPIYIYIHRALCLKRVTHSDIENILSSNENSHSQNSQFDNSSSSAHMPPMLFKDQVIYSGVWLYFGAFWCLVQFLMYLALLLVQYKQLQ